MNEEWPSMHSLIVSSPSKSLLCSCAGPDWYLMKRTFFLPVIGAGLIAGCATHTPKYEEPETADFTPIEHTPLKLETPYRFPLISIGEKFSGLPPSVQNTIRAQVGSLPLADIQKDTSSGQTIYKVLFKYEDVFPPLLIAPDGSVLNPDLTVAVAAPEEHIGVPTRHITASLKTSDLPPPVMKSIQDRAPSGEIASIYKEVWGEHDIYIVSFKDPAHNPRLYIAADGTMAGGTHTP